MRKKSGKRGFLLALGQISPSSERIVEKGKQEIKKRGLGGVIKATKKFRFHGDGEVRSWESVMTFVCFTPKVPRAVKEYPAGEAEPWIEVEPYIGMANHTEAGMWMSRQYFGKKNCVYVGNYPVGSVLGLASPEAEVEFYGTSAHRFGGEGKPVPVKEVMKKL